MKRIRESQQEDIRVCEREKEDVTTPSCSTDTDSESCKQPKKKYYFLIPPGSVDEISPCLAYQKFGVYACVKAEGS